MKNHVFKIGLLLLTSIGIASLTTSCSSQSDRVPYKHDHSKMKRGGGPF